MEDKRYIISETAGITGLEPHVLRYWEEELALKIPRNELGHRYYTKELIDLFCYIKELKEKGYQLKAIRSELTKSTELSAVQSPVAEISNRAADDRMEKFLAIIGNVVTQSLKANNSALKEDISNEVSDRVIKQVDYLFRVNEEAEEERYKRFDETIRKYQKSAKEVAAGSDNKGKRKKNKSSYRKI